MNKRNSRRKKKKSGISAVKVLTLAGYSISAMITLVASRKLLDAVSDFIMMIANALVVSITGVLVNVFIKSSSSKKKKKKDKH